MADDEAARMARLEKRVAKLEANIFLFQAAVAGKLTEALKQLRRRQEMREAKVAEALQKLATELSEVRDRLGTLTGSRLTH